MVAILDDRKLQYTLCRELEKASLLKRLPRTGISMDRGLAALYLKTLAAEVASRNAVALLHDSECDEITSIGFARDWDVTSSPLGCARLALSWPSDSDLMKLSPAAYIRLLDATEGARRSFREQFEGWCSELQTLESELAIREHQRDIVRRLDHEVVESQRALRAFGIEGLNGLLALTVPTSMTAGLSAMGAPQWVTLAGGVAGLGVAIGGWSVQQRNKVFERKHYLLALKDQIDRSALGGFGAQMRQFLFG
jgi:hypothetical protein